MIIPGSATPLLMGGDDGYQISRSVRLRSSVSAYFSRTYSTSRTLDTKGTFSAWIKRGTISAQKFILGGYDGSSAASTGFQFLSGDTLSFDFGGGGANTTTTTQLFRDPSAWYHIVLTIDTTSATSTITGSSTDRVRFYVNGVQVTSFSATAVPSQNSSWMFAINNANNKVGASWSNGAPFDGYLTEINFIDGQALTPTSFGATDAVTGVWNPIRYSGTYGTNGFYLNFSNNSGATATTIGKDSSGNGNNWTPNNISVTNVAPPNTNDSMVDTPTNYGIDTGAGGEVRGSYAVVSPVTGYAYTSSNGNLTTYGSNTNCYFSMPIIGKMYFEAYCTAVVGGGQMGFVKNASIATNTIGYNQAGYYGVNYASGAVTYWVNGTNDGINHGTISGNTLKFAVDGATGKVWIGSGSTWFGSGDPANGTNPAFTISLSSGDLIYPMITSQSSTYTFTINTGQHAFGNAAPSGFKAMCTQNMTTPTISNGANYMAAKLYTGSASSQSVTNTVNGISFQPDLVWVKNRTNGQDHKLTDSVRGTTKALVSDSTAAETTDANGVTAFNSNGFSLGAGTRSYSDTNADSYVGWQWKGGGTGVSNTQGTITSTVSANTTAGFSVVAYTGNGVTSATVGHGLGVTPSMIITKNRDIGTSAYNWYTNHVSLGAGQLELDLTLASNNPATVFSNGGLAPASSWTSQVFSFVSGSSSANNVNNNGSKFIAYCFAPIAGYSAFGSYTGNGSTDGPFVYCGFRPRWVMLKRTDGANHWIMYDTSRDSYNVGEKWLRGNTADIESTGIYWDGLSNGFKLRTTDPATNASGGTYIYACFAENPFTIARAR